ncbi:DUF177 domain-containing protein [Coprothermobacter platensis]|uniref:DUF177 domain-containing protein n=1 Tax=Coprothermobacter platensis TaxID=108819 RepID=UPI00037CC454|nr:DUF177 domain-containing protein [Coprothermobacter platensis]
MILDLNTVRRQKGYAKIDLPDLQGHLSLPYEIKNLIGSIEVNQWEFEKFDLLIDGSVDVLVPCDRCGQMYWQHVTLDDKELFVIGHEPNREGEEKHLSEDDISTFYTPNGRVDVIELLSEYILNSLPSKLVCSDECAGPEELLQKLEFIDLILEDQGGK